MDQQLPPPPPPPPLLTDMPDGSGTHKQQCVKYLFHLFIKVCGKIVKWRLADGRSELTVQAEDVGRIGGDRRWML